MSLLTMLPEANSLELLKISILRTLFTILFCFHIKYTEYLYNI